MQQRTIRAVLAAVVLTAGLVAVPIGSDSIAHAEVPIGNIGKFKQTFRESFSTKASARGQFAKTYAKSWQPYPDGMGDGKYWSGTQISAHGGIMDVTLDGKHGAAGTFGTPTGAWSHIGGKFTVRAKASGATGNGAAFMLWPTSNVWSEGEIDYPEGNFEAAPVSYQHSMTAGAEFNATSASARVSWRDWHTYSIEWIPNKSVTYFVDNRVVQTVTKDVPKTAHRYMFQTGNWGATGHLNIDWVTTYDYKP
ncbi:Glycosyl hydrolases family 16 [Curtobacterium sp. 9128]|uniref:glycoside hydrolase family 16 protein n=1 Tax=Curtobacterium sp. 9128 TaxID=1793722 RepID=UPI0007D728D5|nr:glycoside hydrolase family 16 protein [Curtobacterium sp. 9128]SBN61324.1 Glycosyl hydrolases family 16 [Curtobacterium sp. 9128]